MKFSFVLAILGAASAMQLDTTTTLEKGKWNPLDVDPERNPEFVKRVSSYHRWAKNKKITEFKGYLEESTEGEEKTRKAVEAGQKEIDPLMEKLEILEEKQRKLEEKHE